MSALLGISARERERAAEAERLFEGRNASALVARLDDPSWVVRRVVVSALARLGDEALEPLRDVLLHRRGNEARVAAAVDALVTSLGNAEQVAIALTKESES